MALWRIKDDEWDATRATSSINTRRPTSSPDVNDDLEVPMYRKIEPLSIKVCQKAEKVRALAYNTDKLVRNVRRVDRCQSLDGSINLTGLHVMVDLHDAVHGA